MSDYPNNEEIAALLREIAAAYEIKGESFFKKRAYENAAVAVEHATSLVKDMWDEDKLDELPGVGKAIAGYLDELFRTGEVKHFVEVKRKLPKGMFALLDIPGVGPKTAYKLAQELKIQSIEELRQVAEAGKVRDLTGFGEKTEKEILESIQQLERKSDRMLLPQADQMAEQVAIELLKVKGVVRVDSLGSLRRKVATIGDVDMAVAVKSDKADQYAKEVINTFIHLPNAKKIIEKGEREASVLWFNHKQIDLRVQDIESYGALLQHYTGSKQHNIHLRKVAKTKKCSLSEYGIKVTKNSNVKCQISNIKIIERGKEQLLQLKSEEDYYRCLGMQWIPPEIREDTGEIEAAMKGKLPKLVELSDIKGDLHAHCDFDLEESHDPGRSSMEEFAQRAIELGYEYISLGSHSPSVYNHSDREMIDLIKKKQEKVNQVQVQFPQIKLLNGIEVDILADGKLAIPDAGLALLDIIIVAIHSTMRQSRDKLTRRVVDALKNPHTHILGHPTGRLLGHREGYELDWEKIFAVVKEYDKAIEINSFYNRLDLPDYLVRDAVKNGVKLVINTDAHEASQLDLMEYGVSVARRGWVEKNIINTRSWARLKKFLQRG